MRRIVRTGLGTLALALAIVAAACGGDDPESGSSGAGTAKAETAAPARLTVGVIPIAPVAPLYLGIKQGFFEDENLEIEPHFEEGGVNVVTAVISGDFDMGFSNTLSLMTAASKGLPLKMLTQGVSGEMTKEEAWGALIVKKGGAIKTPKDLVGKTVSVNTLNNVPHMVAMRSLEKAGVDPKSVKYLEVPFPDAVAAIDSGRVDAAWVVEPFVTIAEQSGAEVLTTPYIDTAPDLTVSTYFTSDKLIEEHPDQVERFIRAMNRSLEYAADHPDDVRKIVGEYTEIRPKAAQSMALPVWHEDLNRPTMDLTIELSRKYGFLKEDVDLDELIWEPGE
jgi:NitT/TauT family transport system substrate-binding protein